MDSDGVQVVRSRRRIRDSPGVTRRRHSLSPSNHERQNPCSADSPAESCSDDKPSQVGNPALGMFVFALMHGVEVKCLLDSGAGRNLLAHTVYQKFPPPLRPALEHTTTRLVSANGSHIGVHGQVDLPVQIGRQVLGVQFIVADCTEEALLGIPFLRQSRARLDFATMKLHVHGEVVTCYDSRARPLNATIRVAKTIILKPRQKYLIPGKAHYRGATPRHALLGPTCGFLHRNNVLLARMLIDTQEAGETICLRVYNPG